MDRFIQFALAAAAQAIGQAGWSPSEDAEARTRAGCIIGTGIGGFPAIAEATRIVERAGPRRLSPFVIPSFLGNLAAGHVSIRHGLQGPLGCPVTACAAGAQAIGDAARDRTSVVEGKSVSVRVDLGGRRTIKKKTTNY